MYKFFLILISFSVYTHAWWDTGHALVCDEAYKRLSPEIQEKVDELIDGRFDNYGAACVWPDEVKAFERPETRPWHYVNLPRGKVKVTEAYCPEDGCILSAYFEQLEILKIGDHAAKQEALGFVGHFIADVHQPLHIGYGFDRGGNDLVLTLNGKERTNMHMIWDGYIINYAFKNYDQKTVEEFINKTISEMTQADLTKDFYAWATESRLLALSKGVGYKIFIDDGPSHFYSRRKNLDDSYLENQVPVVLEQIAKAINRLVFVLENTL